MSNQVSSFTTREDFSRLYEDTHLIVYKYVFYLCGGPEQKVEDITSDTFWRAWKNRKKFFGTEKAAIGWLLRIAKNLIIDDYRKNKVRGIAVDIDLIKIADKHLSPEIQAAQKEQINTMMSLIKTLPVEKSEILILRYGLGWRVKDIGEHLNIAENTVSANIRRSLEKIRNSWPTENG